MIQFIRTPWFIRKWYSSMVWEKKASDTIYLTFDDGPHPQVTPWVLDQLDKVKAKATFFCIGRNIREYPETMNLLIEKGHRIGNHTYNHLRGWGTPTDWYLDDIQRTDKLIDSGEFPNKLFRPPYGRIKRNQIQSLKKQYDIVMWSHLSWDFASPLNLERVIRKLKKAKEGSIIVFHDTSHAFENLKEILPTMLSFYSKKGFKFETL